MSIDQKGANTGMMYNPYKGKSLSGLSGLRTEDHRRSGSDLKDLLGPQHGSFAEKQTPEPRTALMNQTGWPGHSRTMSAVGQQTMNPTGKEQRKVFNFQLDPTFRRDLMKKRMNSKIELKGPNGEFKEENTEGGKDQSPVVKNKDLSKMNFMQMKRQSLDVMEIAEQKLNNEEIHKNKTGVGKISNPFDQIPNKQMLLGIIDKKKSININRLNDRVSLMMDKHSLNVSGAQPAEQSNPTSKDFRGIFRRPDVGASIRGTIPDNRRAPINITREAISMAPQDEDNNLLKEDNPKKFSENILEKPTTGYFSKVFRKKDSQESFEITESRRHQGVSAEQSRQRSSSREVHEVKTQNYYAMALKYNYTKKIIGPHGMLYKEHFIQSVGAIKYLLSKGVNLFQYKDIQVIKGKVKDITNSSEFALRTNSSFQSS